MIGLLLCAAACVLPLACAKSSLEQYAFAGLPGTTPWPTLSGQPTLIIGHRGERAYMPEHTLGSYHLAMYSHVDFVEPDIVLTKDGVPVAYHDLCLKSNTDVADRPEFAHLKGTLKLDDRVNSGRWVVFEDDWCVSNFTLAELKTLKVKVNLRGATSIRPPFFNDLFTIPTFQEYLDLVHDVAGTIKRTFGVIPELKHCKYHSRLRPEQPRYFEDKVLEILKANGYPLKGPIPENRGPLVIQNFEVESAKYIRSKTDKSVLQLIYLNPRLITPKGLDEIAEYADHIGFMKEFYTMGAPEIFHYLGVPYDDYEIQKLGGFISAKNLSAEVKKRNLIQTPYTFYSGYEQGVSFCERPGGCPDIVDRRTELFYFFSIGMDGLFTENNIEALQLRTEFQGLLDIRAGAKTITPTVNYKRSLSKRAIPIPARTRVDLEPTRKKLAAAHLKWLTNIQH